MPTILDERNVLKLINQSSNWARKVDRMTDAEVVDTVLKLMSQAVI
jgi:hypothetical protein